MKLARIQLLVGLFLLLTFFPIGCADTSDSTAQIGQSEAVLTSITLPQALTNGKPTLAEFGSGACIPCKQMKPILEELAVEYEGKLNVAIVEVYEQRSLTQQYGIMTIPTQIVFDASGKEVTRHVGLWPILDIIARLKKMGIE